MSIEIGSKWVNILEKDMEVVEIVFYDFICTKNESFRPWAVGFKSKNDYGVLALKDFIRQYNPYETVYEYKWAVGSDKYQIITDCFYNNDTELCNSLEAKGLLGNGFQRIDFTKRERT